MSESQRHTLLAAHRACEAARLQEDSDRYFYCNEDFHAAIYAGSQNQFLIEQTTQLQRRLRPYPHHIGITRERLLQHRAVFAQRNFVTVLHDAAAVVQRLVF